MKTNLSGVETFKCGWNFKTLAWPSYARINWYML